MVGWQIERTEVTGSREDRAVTCGGVGMGLVELLVWLFLSCEEARDESELRNCCGWLRKCCVRLLYGLVRWLGYVT